MVLVALMVAAAPLAAQSQAGIRGVWRVAEITAAGAAGPSGVVPTVGRTNTNPQPGLYIFTGRHFSIQRVTSTAPRPDLPQNLSQAPDALLAEVWGAYQGSSGTYEIEGDRLITRSTVAKNPFIMAPDAVQEFTFRIQGDNLWLTLTRSPTGPVTNTGTIKLVRVE